MDAGLIADVSAQAVVGVGAALVVGLVLGIVVTLMASRSSHPIDFDWRLRIRRREDDSSDA